MEAARLPPRRQLHRIFTSLRVISIPNLDELPPELVPGVLRLARFHRRHRGADFLREKGKRGGRGFSLARAPNSTRFIVSPTNNEVIIISNDCSASTRVRISPRLPPSRITHRRRCLHCCASPAPFASRPYKFSLSATGTKITGNSETSPRRLSSRARLDAPTVYDRPSRILREQSAPFVSFSFHLLARGEWN